MAYSKDAREMVLEYCKKGHTEEEAHQDLKPSVSTIYRWRKQLRETGTLESKERQRKPQKLPDEELRSYIAEHPDAFFTEIADHFKCSDEAVRKACKRLGITRKKKTKVYKERSEEKREAYLEIIKDISPVVMDFPFAARIVQKSPEYLKKLAQQGKFPGTKVGAEWRITKAALMKYLGVGA